LALLPFLIAAHVCVQRRDQPIGSAAAVAVRAVSELGQIWW
jgi:hypothetical protein